MKNLYLVGFMGTGKSSVGKLIAKKRKCRFADLDELIELKEKKSIPDIFAKYGEAHFRRLEKKALKEISRESNFVVACGGGIVLDKENIQIMNESGLVVCLKASPEVILKRTAASVNRPLLNVEERKEKINMLLKIRAPFYAQIARQVDTSTLSIEEVADKVAGWMKEKP
ncbi:MAG: shikimate kinase [Candidatus Omnitrophota bacterium]|nr:MAG: shikimate kinase [Candidatus Omnitrophota bacterium]